MRLTMRLCTWGACFPHRSPSAAPAPVPGHRLAGLVRVPRVRQGSVSGHGLLALLRRRPARLDRVFE